MAKSPLGRLLKFVKRFSSKLDTDVSFDRNSLKTLQSDEGNKSIGFVVDDVSSRVESVQSDDIEKLLQEYMSDKLLELDDIVKSITNWPVQHLDLHQKLALYFFEDMNINLSSQFLQAIYQDDLFANISTGAGLKVAMGYCPEVVSALDGYLDEKFIASLVFENLSWFAIPENRRRFFAFVSIFEPGKNNAVRMSVFKDGFFDFLTSAFFTKYEDFLLQNWHWTFMDFYSKKSFSETLNNNDFLDFLNVVNNLNPQVSLVNSLKFFNNIDQVLKVTCLTFQEFLDGAILLHQEFGFHKIFSLHFKDALLCVSRFIEFAMQKVDFKDLDFCTQNETIYFFSFLNRRNFAVVELFQEVFLRENLTHAQKLEYVKAFGLITSSKVMQVKKLHLHFFRIVAKSNDPIKTVEMLEDQYSNNLLPEFSKRFRIFKLLNEPNSILRHSRIPSFKDVASDDIVSLILKDLVRVSVKSSDLEIQQFVDLLSHETEFFEFNNNWELKPNVSLDNPRLLHFLESLKRLYLETFDFESREVFSPDLFTYYRKLRDCFDLEDSQSVSDKFVSLYCKDLNINSVYELQDFFSRYNKLRDNLKRVENPLLQSSTLELKKGYLLKGLDFDYFSEVLQRGFVAREFVGAASESDNTPFDIDLWCYDAPFQNNSSSIVRKENVDLDSDEIFKYGDVTFIIVPDDDFVFTEYGTDTDSYVSSKVEYFRNGYLANNHYGIRTGLSTDKISGLQLSDSLLQDRSKFLRMKLDLVINQKYLPIFNSSGDLIFTTQEYDEMQRLMTNGRAIMFLNNVLDVSQVSLDDLSLRNLYLIYKDEFNTQVVSEGYDLLTHTFMVLKQLDKLESNVTLPEGVSLEELRLFLTLHDIGKPRSIITGSSQHNESLSYIQEIVERFNLNQNTRRLFNSLIKQDLIGELVKSLPEDVGLYLGNLELIKRHVFDGGELNLSLSDFELVLLKFLTDLKSLSVGAQMEPGPFLQVFDIYFKCDASSYTSDSEGYASLDFLFENLSEHGPLEYNSNIQTLLDALYMVL